MALSASELQKSRLLLLLLLPVAAALPSGRRRRGLRSFRRYRCRATARRRLRHFGRPPLWLSRRRTGLGRNRLGNASDGFARERTHGKRDEKRGTDDFGRCMIGPAGSTRTSNSQSSQTSTSRPQCSVPWPRTYGSGLGVVIVFAEWHRHSAPSCALVRPR